jgi:TPR repeat protein
MVPNNRCLLRLALIAPVFSLIPLPAQADYEQGLRAYKRNDFSRARTEFFQSAIQSHPNSQYYLGEIYEGGVGVNIDYPSAFKWYHSAAQLGHAQAQRRVAYLYSQGLGTGKDQAKAFAWYLRSANNGDVLGQLEVGRCYRQGLGTGRNPTEAYKWLTISASYGDPDALVERGKLDVELSAADKQQAMALARDWERQWEKRKNPGVP